MNSSAEFPGCVSGHVWDTLARMSYVQNPQEEILQLVTRWQPDAKVTAIHPLTPDMSLRRYFRLEGNFSLPETSGVDTMLAMLFDSVASPEVGLGESKDSDLAYLELTELLGGVRVRVPAVYTSKRDPSVILIEDLGDDLLAEVFLKSPAVSRDSSKAAEFLTYMSDALEQLSLFRNISIASDSFACRRGFTRADYAREMYEFVEFFLSPRSCSPELLASVDKLIDHTADHLLTFDRVLAHRDYHGWNLMLDGKSRIRVIDFQDSLLATTPYDLVGFLNDRDMDVTLGLELYRWSLDYFCNRNALGDEFRDQYYWQLLQRDLKVAGRFRKIVTVRGIQRYDLWVPGTVRRIGRTLTRLSESQRTPALVGECLKLLSEEVDLIVEGAQQYREGW